MSCTFSNGNVHFFPPKIHAGCRRDPISKRYWGKYGKVECTGVISHLQLVIPLTVRRNKKQNGLDDDAFFRMMLARHHQRRFDMCFGPEPTQLTLHPKVLYPQIQDDHWRSYLFLNGIVSIELEANLYLGNCSEITVSIPFTKLVLVGSGF